MGDIEDLIEDVVDSELKFSEIPTFFQDQPRFVSPSTTPELQKSAEGILAGIKRPTAVEGNVCLPFTFSSSQDDFHDNCLKFPFFLMRKEKRKLTERCENFLSAIQCHSF